MKLLKPIFVASLASLAALVVGVSSRSASADTGSAPRAPAGLCHDQTHMAAALTALRDAKASLAKAEHNKDGWRVDAMKSTELAIAKTEIGCASAKSEAPMPVAPEAPTAGLCHDQPNMAAALTSLRTAKGELEKAEHNKEGWRAEALNATEVAIAKTELGCASTGK